MNKKVTLILVLLILNFSFSSAQTKFKYIINGKLRTSAAVYQTDGTLVRTLWKNEPAVQGQQTGIWDNRDDNGNIVPQGKYTIKVLTDKVTYVWNGPIGNTSSEISGIHVFQGFYPLMSMAVTDTALYFVTGYNENAYNLHWVNPADVTRQNSFGHSDTFTAVGLICTDGKTLYVADNMGGFHEGGVRSFVYALNVKDKSEVVFPAGHSFSTNDREKLYSSVIDLDEQSLEFKTMPPPHLFIQNAASGMAVQSNGPILAIAHYGNNTIRLFNKISGALLNTIEAPEITALSMAANGDLWAISGNTVVRYAHLAEKQPSIITTISNLTDPVALAADPQTGQVLIADGGSSQQLKAFSATGTHLWTMGEAGGYDINGAQVSTHKFWFRQVRLGDMSFVAILKDHSFWIGDTGNNRALHFSKDHSYIEQIMYQPTNYSAFVDATDSSRVFSQFLEFKVNYPEGRRPGWKLVRNWKAGVDPSYFSDFNGLRQVTTLKNHRTYGIVVSEKKHQPELVELQGNFLRKTASFLPGTASQRLTLLPGGDLIITPLTVMYDSIARWYRASLLGFDASGNPLWDVPALAASAYASKTDPLPRNGGFGDIRSPVSSRGILISFDQSKNQGYHLGGIKLGSDKWLWKASPTGSLDTKGSFDVGNGVQYAGNTAMTSGRNVFYGYHGEFWNQSQAGRFMHYYDDGMFIGEFGESSKGHGFISGAIYGFAGNGFSPSLVRVKDKIVLWVNDESSNGPQSWTINNTASIKELSGTGQLNTVLILSGE